MRARVARLASVRQRIEREEAVRDDFTIGLRRAVLAEVAHDVQRHMVAPRRPLVEEHAVQPGGAVSRMLPSSASSRVSASRNVSPVSTPPPGRCQPST